MRSFDAYFYVLPNLTYNIILGMNFLKRHKAVIDASDNSIHFGQVELPKVYLTTSISIPAFSSAGVEVTTDRKLGKVHELNNCEDFNIRYGVQVGQGPIRCNKKTFMILLSNFTDKMVSLQKKPVSLL